MKSTVSLINSQTFDASFFLLKNTKYGFFYFREQSSVLNISKLCFSLSSDFFFLKGFNSVFFVNPSRLNQTYLVCFKEFLKIFLALRFFFKQRLRFSGLGFGLDVLKETNQLQINVGFTQPPVVKLPAFISIVKLNKKRKKVMFKSYSSYLLNDFAANIRHFRFCDVYKHKGIRWRFEKVRTKAGKRSGKR